MKNINIKIWLILLALIASSVSMQAQTLSPFDFVCFQDTCEYTITTHTETLDYAPLATDAEWFKGKGAIGWLVNNVALNVTNNKTEMDITKSYNKNIKVHLYYPKRNEGTFSLDQTKLPVIVFGYGGGFLKHWSTNPIEQGYDDVIPRWLAKRGFIVVCPEYRIGIDLYNEHLSERAIWRAVQDLRVVNRYAREISNEHTNADQDKPLTYLGWSSGAFMGLHNLYLENTGTNRPASTKDLIVSYNPKVHWYEENDTLTNPVYDLGNLDTPRIGTGDDDFATGLPAYQGDPVQDITVSISGALGKLSWINTSTNPKPKALFMMHHELDGVVPNREGNPYKNFGLFANPNYDYPTVHGTHDINDLYNAAGNEALKPAIYQHTYIDPNCGLFPSDLDCINGDAGGETGALGYKIWHHDPMEGGANEDVMNEILNFIGTSTTTLTTGVANRSLNTVQEPLRVEEAVNIEEALIVYPNPAKGKFSIKIGDYEEAYKLEGYDFTGNLLVTEKITNPTTDVYTVDSSKLIPGLYVFKLYTNSGIKTAKVMIE